MLLDYQRPLEIRSTALSYQDQAASSQGELASNLIRLYKAMDVGCPALDSQAN